MAAVFFTKKQKKQMQERRKRKLIALKADNSEATFPQKKQKLDDISKIERPEKSNKCLAITIPEGLKGKELKKFRKDSRRKARKEGYDDSLISFTNEGQEEKERSKADDRDKKKVSKVFPRINEILKQQKEENAEKEKEKKKQEAEDLLPVAYKARHVALDCEMVGIGSEGKKSALARVTITDWNGSVLYDSHVQVPSRVTDFRTHVSGILPKHIQKQSALAPEQCRKEVGAIIKGKILVGHALQNDLQVLFLQHPKEDIRDTAKYRPFQRLAGSKWRPRKLRDLVKQHLRREIQKSGEVHDSIEDAAAAMELFKQVRETWEKDLRENQRKLKRKG